MDSSAASYVHISIGRIDVVLLNEEVHSETNTGYFFNVLHQKRGLF